MPLRKVKFVPGHYYHIFNRGVNRQSIFGGDEDFINFLKRLKHYTTKYAVSVIAYCLMPNHFHLLVRQDGDRSSGQAVQHACNGYAQWFNRRHERQGALFQGRFQARLVDDAVYLRHLCRYIHANPVKDGFALTPDLWPYSNYQDWIGKRNGTLLDPAFVSMFFTSAAAYVSFVADYLSHTTDMPRELREYLAGLNE